MSPNDDAAPGTDPARDRRRELLVSGHSGTAAEARRALEDSDPRLRVSALVALVRQGELSAGALAAALEDPHPDVRRKAAELAPALPGRPTADALVRALQDEDPLVAEMAAWALGESALQPGVIGALSSMATAHSDPLCREAAVAALGALGDPAGLPAVLAGATDKPAIRRRAVIALAAFEGPEVEAALERALSDRDWQVRQAAEDLGDRPGRDT